MEPDPEISEAARGPARPTIRLIQPSPARLSTMSAELAALERSGIYSNYGPLNQRLEAAFVGELFEGEGACVTVCNATIGLMLAIKQATMRQRPQRRYALMPSFTFAATAHAALWNGLTPILCDIDPVTWLPATSSMQRAIDRYGDEIAVVIPCTTLGYPEEMARYADLVAPIGAALVVDAAASIGTAQSDGRQFGVGSSHATVFSLHATKAFATFEGGLVYAGDPEVVAELRRMGNFGFGGGRAADLPGLNSKLDEVTALAGLAQLERLPEILRHRAALAAAYREALPDFDMQPRGENARAYIFMSVLLPWRLKGQRARIVDELARRGVQVGHYYDPHLAAQPYFAECCVDLSLEVTADVAARILSLPLHDGLEIDDVHHVAALLRDVTRTP